MRCAHVYQPLLLGSREDVKEIVGSPIFFGPGTL
jgi:hypothetical protein